MLTAIAIDDEPDALEVVQMLASKVPFLDLKATFTNAFEAISYLRENNIDLIFLDIKMPDISGLEFVKCLQKVPLVIFTTAYSQYALQGFELDAVDYLLKPFSLARFTKACNKALDQKELRSNSRESFLFVKTGYQDEKVVLDDVLYIEAEGNYLKIVTADRQLLTRQTIQDILQQLPADEFLRVHRSYVVPLRKIELFSRFEIGVAGNKIPIGASYEAHVARLRDRMGKK